MDVSKLTEAAGDSKLGGAEIVNYAKGVFNLWLKV